KGGIEIELLERDPSVRDEARRKSFEPLEQRLRFGSAVRLDIANDNIDALRPFAPGRFEHGVGLAHTGRVAEENLQLPASRASLVGLHEGQQFIGIGSLIHGSRSTANRLTTALPDILSPSLQTC